MVQLTGGPSLSSITQVIVGPDSIVYLLDAMTDGVLEYNASGAFERPPEAAELAGALTSPADLGFTYSCSSRLRVVATCDGSSATHVIMAPQRLATCSVPSTTAS